MARRRRQYLSDGDSSEDYDSASLDEGDYSLGKRKRTKEDAIYGDFLPSDEENGAGRTVKGFNRKGKKINYRSGQAFVPSTGLADKPKEQEEQGSDSEDRYSEAEEFARKPITEEEEIETTPAFAGIGSGAGPTAQEAVMRNEQQGRGFKPASFVSSRGGIGSRSRTDQDEEQQGEASRGGRGGIGSSRGGIGARGGIGSMASFVSAGSSKIEDPPPPARGGLGSFQRAEQHPTFEPSALEQAGVPSSFSRPPPPGPPPKEPTFTPQAQTNIKFGNKFDPSAYLASMGWTGGGLGKSGEGIVVPIEVKLRPERAGIAFGGRKEKTKQAKDEARRRGEPVSSDEDQPKRKSKVQRPKKEVQAWTKAEKKPRKPKVEHRTYEQIIEEAGGMPSEAGLGQIIDATGKELREVSSLASALANRGIPSETEHLPELRHNLRLICDTNLQTLTVLAKEGASIFERRKWLKREAEESQRRKTKEVLEVATLNEVMIVIGDLEKLGASGAEDLALFDEPIRRLVSQFEREIEVYNLDEAVVGALAPTLRRTWSDWDPLATPELGVSHLTQYLPALRLSHPAQPHMTPYESLIWTHWMPRLRSSINRHFSASRTIAVIEAWKPLLPAFVLDNILDQLVLPKVQASVHDWTARSRLGLHQLVFPWLPVLGRRMDETVSEAKRRLRSSLKHWTPAAGVPESLVAWRPLLKAQEWDSLLLAAVLPKLAVYLRDVFQIVPAQQEMAPLEHVMQWKSLLPAAMLSRLLETEFFPKWLRALHAWLTSRDGRLDNLAEWYEFWKAWFPPSVLGLEGVGRGFERGIRLIDQAVDLGDDRTKLPLPDLAPAPRNVKIPQKQAEEEEVSFKSIIVEAAAKHDLLLQPLSRLHPTTSLPLYRLSTNLDGKKGTTFYLSDDVIFLPDDTPLSLEALIEKSMH